MTTEYTMEQWPLFSRAVNTLQQVFSRKRRIKKKLRQRVHHHEETDSWARRAIEVLARKLSRRGSLNDLQNAISHPERPSRCVPLQRNGLDDSIQVMHYTAAAHALACKLWRWPDLQSHFELRSLPHCAYPLSRSTHHDNICLNPYHYERIEWTPDMPAILVPTQLILQQQQLMIQQQQQLLEQQQLQTLQRQREGLMWQQQQQQQQQQHIMMQEPMIQQQPMMQQQSMVQQQPMVQQQSMMQQPPAGQPFYPRKPCPIHEPHLLQHVQQQGPYQQPFNQQPLQPQPYQQLHQPEPQQTYLQQQQQQQQQHQQQQLQQLHQPQTSAIIFNAPTQRPSNYVLPPGIVDVEPCFPPSENDFHEILTKLADNNPRTPILNTPPPSGSDGNTSSTVTPTEKSLPGSANTSGTITQNSSTGSESTSSSGAATQKDENMNIQNDEKEEDKDKDEPVEQSEPMATLDNDGVRVEYEDDPIWIKVAYYEYNTRIGDVYTCRDQVLTIDGFTNMIPQTNRFSLGTLSTAMSKDISQRIRRAIGRGIQLHRANGRVMLENLSTQAVYVQSRCANALLRLALTTVIKVPAGSTLKLFDNSLFETILNNSVQYGFEAVYDLTQFCIIRLSFVKGWGEQYKQLDASDTPCWIETHLNAPLKWVDKILQSLGSASFPCSSVS